MTPEYEIPPFRIREYGKTELAVLYSPHLRTVTAVKKLRRWIRGNRPLMAALAEADYNPRRLSYTPARWSSSCATWERRGEGLVDLSKCHPPARRKAGK